MRQIHKQSKSPFGMMFEELFNRSISEVMGVDQTRSIPQVNIHETSTAYVVELATPGLSKDSFTISVEKNILTVQGKRAEAAESEVKVLRKEYNYDAFRRNFTLSDDVRVDNIEATYTDGVLQIVIEKLPSEVLNKVTQIAVD